MNVAKSWMWVGSMLLCAGVWSGEVTRAAETTVFDAAPAETLPVLREGVPTAGGPLRVLTVEERVGISRSDELVRVPLFFHPGECTDVNGLELYDLADSDKAPIAYQADDIRKSADGQIARMHVYFYASLKPWERRQYAIKPGANPGAKLPPIPMQQAGQGVIFSAEGIKVGFLTQGPRAGAVTQLETSFGKLNLLDGWMGPTLKLSRQEADKLRVSRKSEISYANPDSFEVKSIQYASGPLFAKLRVQIAAKGTTDIAENTYLIPRRGSLMVITQRTFAEDAESGAVVASAWPILLGGRATFGKEEADAEIVKVPVGLRKLLRWVQNQRVEAAVSTKAGFSLMQVPCVAHAGGISYPLEDSVDPEKPRKARSLEIFGPGTLRRNGDSNSGTLRAFWIQSRLLFAPTTDFEKLYDLACANSNQLTAVVDEPGLELKDLETAFSDAAKVFQGIQHWGKGWQQEAAIAYLRGNDAQVKKIVEGQARPAKDPKRDQSLLENWAPEWARSDPNARPPLEKPKGSGGKGTPPTDPYNQGYANSSMVPFAQFVAPSERLDQVCMNIAKASMLVNGSTYKEGFPRISAFSNAYNMQIGSIYFGIYAGKKMNDPWMTLFYRDVNKFPGAASIYGHGERCYSGDMRNAEQSDVLYQAISDLWLRSIELALNENMSVHPATYGRYADCVDVTGDLQHRSLDGSGKGWYRGNFFRGQAHDHRWEAWDAMPYAILQQNADEQTPVGITDAIYFARNFAERNTGTKFGGWSQLMNFFHPMFNLKVARHQFQPPALPALPDGVKVAAGKDGGATISWNPVKGDIAGYRVYRSFKMGSKADQPGEMGDALNLLNSPYRPEDRAELVKETRFNDPAGDPRAFYFVTAVDSKGYESSWFPNEPVPRPGKPVPSAK